MIGPPNGLATVYLCLFMTTNRLSAHLEDAGDPLLRAVARNLGRLGDELAALEADTRRAPVESDRRVWCRVA